MIVLFVGMGAVTAWGETIYVKYDAAGINNGSSWGDAYNSLQAGLDVAN